MLQHLRPGTRFCSVSDRLQSCRTGSFPPYGSSDYASLSVFSSLSAARTPSEVSGSPGAFSAAGVFAAAVPAVGVPSDEYGVLVLTGALLFLGPGSFISSSAL